MRSPGAAWPEALDARRQLVADVENELVLGRTRYPFVRLASAGEADACSSNNRPVDAIGL